MSELTRADLKEIVIDAEMGELNGYLEGAAILRRVLAHIEAADAAMRLVIATTLGERPGDPHVAWEDPRLGLQIIANDLRAALLPAEGEAPDE